MSPIATALVNWSELWKIILTALVSGTGVVIVFGLLLLGISRGRTATRPATRYALFTLSGLCCVLVVAVSAFGIYGMTLRAHDGETDITGPIIDQSQLYGLLERIASLGLTLHSLTPIETKNARTDAQPHTQPAGIDYHNPGANSKER